MTIRGVCFDATGTLIETRESVGAVYGRAAGAVGVKLPAWRLDDAFLRVLRHGPDLASAATKAPATTGAGATTQAEREAAELAWWRDRVRQTFQATDSTIRFADPEAVFRPLFDHYRSAEAWRVRPGVHPLLERLRRDGYRLGLASNFDHRLPEILEVLGLNDFFEIIEIPSRSGLAKPDLRVFEHVAGALGICLEELAYVGDDAPEVLAAIAGHGLHVFDVRALPDLVTLADSLGSDARPAAANLAPSAAPSNPAHAEE